MYIKKMRNSKKGYLVQRHHKDKISNSHPEDQIFYIKNFAIRYILQI